MLRSAQVFTRFEYRLASRLMQAPWLEGSAHKRRLTMHLFRRCANAGHVDALSTYGVMLFRRGHTARDKARGVRCVVKAAEAGHPEAQYQVGHMYEHGCTQFARREDRAVTWYARAAEAGHNGAAQRLARAFDHGELGLPVDPERSRHWQLADDDTAIAARPMTSMPGSAPALQ
ncbi:tetratricopeptide repeat protein [Kushneria sp. TE3]|uniref:tetratricopeptide repeat protein n=1 Tax=Kushneria sp. TE3 TaxID=3449832 RepID=UPI003F686096